MDRGARNEAYFSCTPECPVTKTTKQMDFFSSLLNQNASGIPFSSDSLKTGPHWHT